MEDQKLTQLIADSLELSEAEEREQKALAEAQQVEFDRLVSEATVARLAQTKGFPPALLPYCKARTRRGPWGLEDDLQTLKTGNETWWPDEFWVIAPGLAALRFSIEQEWDDGRPDRQLTGQYLIKEISVDGLRCQSWHQAIAAASQLHRDKQERERIGREIAMSTYKAEMREPTTAERLEILIREIVEEAIHIETARL
jgi:hypothetical protein